MAEVRIEGITKKFGDVTAVGNFNAIIKDGEFVAILGPSGCGKTTMLRMIAGFEKATSGEIYIGDKLVSSSGANTFLPPEKRNIGMVFQSYAVWPHMTVFDNVAYPLKIKKVPKAEMQTRTQRALELVHLGGYEARFPNQLSGGQQQRVALARALVAEPRLLLLDEPLSNLDAKLRESMRFEIKELQKKLNITVIYVTHDQAEAMAMSDRIVVMSQGVIQQTDTPVNIYENPANHTVADFIGLVNFVDGEVQNGMVWMPGLNYRLSWDTQVEGKALIAVRPENIRMTASLEGEGASGRIIRKFYLGDAVDYRVNINGTVIRVIDGARNARFEDDDPVSLVFQKVMVFPAMNRNGASSPAAEIAITPGAGVSA